MPRTQDYEVNLRPYVHHGVDLPNDPKQAVGRCPFCGKEKHFSVKTETGQFRCLVCEETGNIASFLQLLYTRSLDTTDDASIESLAAERSLDFLGLKYFGIATSTITREWLIPHYNNRGVLSNLTRMVKQPNGKYSPFATPGCKMWPFGIDQFLKAPKPNLYIGEGFWDMVALWGLFSQYRMAPNKFIKTANANSAISATTSVIGAPGAGNFQADWFEFLGGRNVFVPFDNDYPLIDDETGQPRMRKGQFIRPGWDGMQRIAELSTQQTKFRPKSLSLLHWGDEPGHNPKLPNHFDMRDCIRTATGEGSLDWLYFSGVQRFKPVVLPTIVSPKNGATAPPVTPIECKTFQELVRHYKENLHFTKPMEDTLAVMLAVVTSTKFPADGQLWFRVIGPPGSGKTTLAEAISAAREYVAPKSILTGFHSGFVDYAAEEGEEANLLTRLNGKCVVMKDADTLLSSPSSGRIMSELRDIFDGTSRSEYRNKVGFDFEDLRMTFILCGTQSLRTMDDSHLGARFLDIELMAPGDDHKPFLDRASRNTYDSMAAFMERMQKPEKDEGEFVAPTKAAFLKQVTYGFIKYFEENFSSLKPPHKSAKTQAVIDAMAELVSYMRARIHREGRSDDIAYRHNREVPTRLVQQLTRLPFCLALVLGKTEIDDEVLTITRKVMVDTSCGFQFEIAHELAKLQPTEGLSVNTLARSLSLSDSTVRRTTEDMFELDVIGAVKSRNNSGQRGRDSHLLQLTPGMYNIWNLAMYGSDEFAGFAAHNMVLQNIKRNATHKKESTRARPKSKRR